MFTQVALLALAALTPLVNAHGHMSAIVIDGTQYDGPEPASGDSGQFAIRQVNTVDPVKGTDNQFLSCGSGATPAALTVPAKPGSVVGFKWHAGDDGAWVHNTGPVQTYMAPCTGTSCTNFDSTQAQWFKIDEKGLHADGVTWFMSDYNGNPDATLDVTLPTNLPAGEYLVRHELIALQNSATPGGAEFYSACAQVSLSASTKSDAKLPASADTVTLPGAYSDSDPGILVPGIYNGNLNYVFPGPQVINDSENLPSGSDTGSDPTGSDAAAPGTPTSSDSSNATDTAAPTPTSTSTSGSGSGSGCGGNSSRKMKRVVKRVIRQEVRKIASKNKRSFDQQAAKREVHHPVRSNSRVMRGLNLN